MSKERKLQSFTVRLRKGDKTKTVHMKALNVHMLHQKIRSQYPDYDHPDGPDIVRTDNSADRLAAKKLRGKW